MARGIPRVPASARALGPWRLEFVLEERLVDVGVGACDDVALDNGFGIWD